MNLRSMAWSGTIRALLLLGASVGSAGAQGADDCANAVGLGVGSVAAAFDTAQCSDTGAPATTTPLAIHPCQNGPGADVWFRWTATRTGDARFAVCGALSNFDSKLGLWRGAQCSTLVPLACNDDGCGLQSVIVWPVAVNTTYYVQLGFFTDQYAAGTNVWGAGTLTIDELAPVPNDTCATATQIPMGATSVAFDTLGATSSGFGGGGCSAPVGPDVFFRWTVPANGHYELSTCGSNGDTVLSAHGGLGCNASCEGSNDDACGLQSTLQLLWLQAGDAYLVQVAGFGPQDRPSGLLQLMPFTPPACALMDDMYEENDVCGQAAALVDGTYSALVCRENDNDFFSVVVQPGRDLVVAALFVDALADLDLYLWDPVAPGAPCGTVTNGPGQNNGALDGSFSATNHEVVTYHNAGLMARTVLIEVDFFSTGTQACNEYELVVHGASSAPVGATFCAPTNNSSGTPSTLWVNQVPVAQDPTLRMTVAPLPLSSSGFLLMSRGTGANLPISSGILCLDLSTLLRLQLFVTNSGAAGLVEFSFPWAIAPAQILQGETWYFQYWHRDAVPNGPALANVSRGLALQFQ